MYAEYCSDKEVSGNGFKTMVYSACFVALDLECLVNEASV
jgi:hypothetical protein